MKKNHYLLFMFVLLFLACKNNVPVEILEDDKTYLTINNKTKYDVKIYHGTEDNFFLEVPAGGKATKVITPSLNIIAGDYIFIKYEYKIGDVSFTYFDNTDDKCVRNKPIIMNQENLIEIENISLNIKESFLIINNQSDKDVMLYGKDGDGNYEKPIEPIGSLYDSESSWILSKKEKAYEIKDSQIDYEIRNNNSDSDTGTELKLDTVQPGFAYFYTYTGNTCELTNISHLDGTEHSYSGTWQLIEKPETAERKKAILCNICGFEEAVQSIPVGTTCIQDESQLAEIKTKDSSTARFELFADIDGGGDTWTPIETFKGTLIGNGYSIKNFSITTGSSWNWDNGNTGYSGFCYKNQGYIKNIYFKDMNLKVDFKAQTSDWRYVNVGLVAGANYGEISNVHLENITVTSTLNHGADRNGDNPKQINIVGGIVGKNYETIASCSVRHSSISASADSWNNRCDTASWAGGICGENTKDCLDLLSIDTSVSANTKGGYNGWTGSDGSLESYAGSIFGIIKGSGSNSRLVSYENPMPIAYIYANSCDNVSQDPRAGYIYGAKEHDETNPITIHGATDLETNSSKISGWGNGWSVTTDGPENYLEM